MGHTLCECLLVGKIWEKSWGKFPGETGGRRGFPAHPARTLRGPSELEPRDCRLDLSQETFPY